MLSLQQYLLDEDHTNKNTSTTCMDIKLSNISSIAAYEHEYAGLLTAYYHITFTSEQGPSIWQATVDHKGSIESVSMSSSNIISS